MKYGSKRSKVALASIAYFLFGSIASAQETEISNDQGNPVRIQGNVVVGNRQPIGVIERFPNTSYTIIEQQQVNGDGSRSASVVVPVASHLRGITVSASPGGFDPPNRCLMQLLYPSDPAQRPVNQTNPFILQLEMTPDFVTTHVPLYEMFVGQGVALQVRLVGAGADSEGCDLHTTLHLRPVPGGIQP
jgi:hypothetical protein